MAFEKGQSGNPRGRPKSDLMGVQAMQSIARGAAPEALKILIETMKDDRVKHDVRIRAADMVLTRAYGPARGSGEGARLANAGFVALLPTPMPAEDWLATFAPKQIIEHEPVALPQPANDTSAEGSSATDDCKD